jgi:hypothetical protein
LIQNIGGRWKLEARSWKVEGGRWKLEARSSKLEAGRWKVEGGSLKLEGGRWKLEGGNFINKNFQDIKFKNKLSLQNIFIYNLLKFTNAINLFNS